jgi:SNF2 family DNA or RNA helicase
VVSGADREILPALPASRDEVLQRRGRQGNSGHSRPRTRSSSAPTSSLASKPADVANTAWDLVVIDEAHRLRNVYKPTNIIANTLKQALKNAPTLLLTATPLQNSLLELFGLVSFIDEHAFGDLKAFREQFANLSQEKVFDTLKSRLKPICHRTLRRQVTAYVSFHQRHPILEEFTPEESEDRLYELVSEYLRRENLQALPASQRSLMTLVLRKLLASSTFAIAGALASISERLKAKIKKKNRRSRWKRSWIRITRLSMKPPRNGARKNPEAAL